MLLDSLILTKLKTGSPLTRLYQIVVGEYFTQNCVYKTRILSPQKKPVENTRSSVKRPGIQDEAVAVTADGTPGHKMSGNPKWEDGGRVDLQNDFDLRSLTWIFHIWGFPKIMVPPKSSILTGFSIINHPFWGYHYFWKHPYIHIFWYIYIYTFMYISSTKLTYSHAMWFSPSPK